MTMLGSEMMGLELSTVEKPERGCGHRLSVGLPLRWSKWIRRIGAGLLLHDG